MAPPPSSAMLGAFAAVFYGTIAVAMGFINKAVFVYGFEESNFLLLCQMVVTVAVLFSSAKRGTGDVRAHQSRSGQEAAPGGDLVQRERGFRARQPREGERAHLQHVETAHPRGGPGREQGASTETRPIQGGRRVHPRGGARVPHRGVRGPGVRSQGVRHGPHVVRAAGELPPGGGENRRGARAGLYRYHGVQCDVFRPRRCSSWCWPPGSSGPASKGSARCPET